MDYPDSPDLFEGKFTDGDPVAGIPASVASADHMNAVYDELKALIVAGGIVPGTADLAQVAKSVGNQLRSKQLFDVSGTANAIVLTSPVGKQPITALSDYDEFSFIVAATNTASSVTIQIDDLDPVSLTGVTDDTQVIITALLTVRHIGGAFYIANQANPLTGNQSKQIGKLQWETLSAISPGQMFFDGGELSRLTHPILFAKAQKTGLVDQTAKDADMEMLGGRWGDGDGTTTFTIPKVDKVIKPAYGSRLLGSYEGDAMRNFTGTVGLFDTAAVADGVFSEYPYSESSAPTGSGTPGTGFIFDPSTVVPTADENRSKTTAFYAVFDV